MFCLHNYDFDVKFVSSAYSLFVCVDIYKRCLFYFQSLAYPIIIIAYIVFDIKRFLFFCFLFDSLFVVESL